MFHPKEAHGVGWMGPNGTVFCSFRPQGIDQEREGERRKEKKREKKKRKKRKEKKREGVGTPGREK